MSLRHIPLGPGGSWKTGQRVPAGGQWVDQFGEVDNFVTGTTFPPCIGRKAECAYRTQVI